MRYPLVISTFIAMLGMAGTAGAVVDNNTIIHKERSSLDSRAGTSFWSIAMENDLFAGGSRDKDYSFGLTATYTGPNATSSRFSPYRFQHHLDKAFIPQGHLDNYSMALGFYGFTPDNIKTPQPIHDDRPYASLIYLQSTRETVHLDRNESWTSSLTVGALGLNLVGSVQNKVHKILNGNEARGWDNQISDGGELTARYSVARQKSLLPDNHRLQLKSTRQLSVGYLTEASYALSFRSGTINSSWWSFDPELASYGEYSSVGTSHVMGPERYWWGGVMLKLRGYNAFLQGQFRDSEVTYDHSDLRPLLAEAWLGYTWAMDNGFRISYWLRGHTSEIKHGSGDRSIVWGGFGVSRSF